MFKKLNLFFFALFSFFILSCNFSFNNSKTTSITVSCSRDSSRVITESEKEAGIINIYILGDKTNHYVHREGPTYSTFYFDDLPPDTYLIHVDFHVNKILRATAEDIITVKALQNETVTLLMEEVETKYESDTVYPEVIEEWAKLKNLIETENEYETFIISDMDITDKITVNRNITLLATDDVLLNCLEVTEGVISITNSNNAQLIFDTTDNHTIYISGNHLSFSESFIVASNPIEMNNVICDDFIFTGSGGFITSRNKVVLNNCKFEKIKADGNGAVVYCERGNFTLKGNYYSSDLTTKLINDTLYSEDFYLIADGNPEYTFADVNCNNIVVYVQNNNKPTINVTEDCKGYDNTLVLESLTGFSATEKEPWKILFNSISDITGASF